ncbi:hypothetical protein B7R56_18820 [Pseudomonas savastanoi pv. retacarpa]|nr:hypothetical protein B7R56_18820 [Pseudomonas savastanoi pv. retacarpa]
MGDAPRHKSVPRRLLRSDAERPELHATQSAAR